VETQCDSCEAEGPCPRRIFFAPDPTPALRICYLDESGVPELGAETAHFVFLGLSIHGETWKAKDGEVATIKRRFGLAGSEIHAAWLARRYLEQENIAGFDAMLPDDRRRAVQRARDAFLVAKAAKKGPRAVEKDRKNFRKTAPYIHLTLAERQDLLCQVAEAVGRWTDCRIFADAIDKRSFGGVAPRTPPYEEGFTQVVSRFHRYLESLEPEEHGLLVEDRNETMAGRLTDLMRAFHARGTRWTEQIRLIVETPLFVDSSLTSLVQVCDLCAYALRRFCDNQETTLFTRIIGRFQRAGGRIVGVRHYTGQRPCPCVICRRHARP